MILSNNVMNKQLKPSMMKESSLERGAGALQTWRYRFNSYDIGGKNGVKGVIRSEASDCVICDQNRNWLFIVHTILYKEAFRKAWKD